MVHENALMGTTYLDYLDATVLLDRVLSGGSPEYRLSGSTSRFWFWGFLALCGCAV